MVCTHHPPTCTIIQVSLCPGPISLSPYMKHSLGNSWPLQKTRDKGKGKEDWLTQSEVGGTRHAMTPTTSSSHTQMRTLRRMKLNFNLRLMRTLGVERSSEKICYVLVPLFTNILAVKKLLQIKMYCEHNGLKTKVAHPLFSAG